MQREVESGKIIPGQSLIRRRVLFGREIRIHLFDTGAGLQVLIEGGDKDHIGAVASAEPGKEMNVITFAGHKEDVICRQWIEGLKHVYDGPIVVSAGVHYDNIERQEIQKIVEGLEQELIEIISLSLND